MKAVNELTKFLTELAMKNEATENGLYKKILTHPIFKKVEALDEKIEESIRAALTQFVTDSFSELMQNICRQYAMLLLEIKTQKDAQENEGTEPDIIKLERMGLENAEKFKILVEILKHALLDIDFEHIAERVIVAGKKLEKTSPFSDN